MVYFSVQDKNRQKSKSILTVYGCVRVSGHLSKIKMCNLWWNSRLFSNGMSLVWLVVATLNITKSNRWCQTNAEITDLREWCCFFSTLPLFGDGMDTCCCSCTMPKTKCARLVCPVFDQLVAQVASHRFHNAHLHRLAHTHGSARTHANTVTGAVWACRARERLGLALMYTGRILHA